MFYNPAGLRRKDARVFLVLLLCVYTFSLMCVLYVSQYATDKLLLQNDSVPTIRSYFNIRNLSRRLSFCTVPIWEETASGRLSMKLKKDQRQNSRRTQLKTKLGRKHSSHHFNSQAQSEYNHHGNIINESRDPVSYFRSRLQGKYSLLLWKTISIFDSVLTDNRIDYMLYGGTLIGSYRHHGLVPWDDDMDVLVPLTVKDSLQRAFTHIRQEYILNQDSDSCWKLFSVLSDPISGCNWRWPYLDIFFYAENRTHIWDVSPKYTYNFSYPKTIIFPLRRRPFMNLTLRAPHNPGAVIDANYDIRLCKSGAWIHRWERQGHELTVPCSLLFSKFAFVRRVFMNGGCNETLVQNKAIISNFFDEGINC